MKLIYDSNEMERLHQILPNINKDLVYFVSLSARNKYLTEEERIKYKLKRTEMFCRTLIRQSDFGNFHQKIIELENRLSVLKTDSGLYFPPHAITCYVNLHALSTIKATNELMKKINDKIFNTIENDIWKQFKYIDKNWITEVQKSKCRSELLDIDFDVSDYSIVDEFIERFNKLARNKVKYLINTKGGWHVILKKEDIGFDFHSIVIELNNRVGPNEEVQINSNNMVPLPGTISGGVPVRFYNDSLP